MGVPSEEPVNDPARRPLMAAPGHPGLDLVIVTRNFGDATGEGLVARGGALWNALVPAIVAQDPRFKGDQAGFCAAYERGSYAPDLR